MQQRLAAVQSLWSSFEARDWATARRLFAGNATMTWHTSGERMLDADAIIRVNAVYPEGWNIRVIEVNALQDGRVHSVVEVSHPPAKFIANSVFCFEQEHIANVDEYWSTVEPPPAWRVAAVIGAYERFDVDAQPGSSLVTIRPLNAGDSLEALTQLLHRAYAPLAQAGMNFTACDQAIEVTAQRVASGHCFVATAAGVVIGTVTVSGAYDPVRSPWALQTEWFYRPDTAHLHQLAVDPQRQGQHIGQRLVARCEQWARERGFQHMALDTAAPAQQLRERYRRLGYREVGEVQWEGKTYRSVIMVKDLPCSAIRSHCLTLARYNLWATRKLFEHVDALPEDDYRRDAGLFFKSVHRTLNHLLIAEHLVWFPRFADGVSNRIALDAEVEPDRVRLRHRLLEGAQRWQPLIAACDEARFDSTLSYTTTLGVAQSMPFAATLAHVFNHGTHHRGQITAAVTAMGHACPELDLLWMLRADNPAPTQETPR